MSRSRPGNLCSLSALISHTYTKRQKDWGLEVVKNVRMLGGLSRLSSLYRNCLMRRQLQSFVDLLLFDCYTMKLAGYLHVVHQLQLSMDYYAWANIHLPLNCVNHWISTIVTDKCCFQFYFYTFSFIRHWLCIQLMGHSLSDNLIDPFDGIISV